MEQWLVISLRVVHILTGAAWVGGAFLLLGFIVPRARTLGPVTGGAYLNGGAWMTSATGLAFSIGGTAAMLALGISVPISTSLSKLYYLTLHLSSEEKEDRDQVSAFEERHTRLARLGAIYTTLLAVAVVGMASAQYLN